MSLYERYYVSWYELNQANLDMQSWLLQFMQAEQDQVLHEPVPGLEVIPDNDLLRALLRMAYTGASIDAIAQALHMSKATLYRHVAEITDESPGDIITTYRIKRACMILKKYDYSIRSVAGMVGFTDSSAFTRRFKQIHGMTPTQWRSQFRK